MIISFANQKGGVGKTTSAINMGAALADLGYRVLLVDFDAQANLTSGVGLFECEHSIYSVLCGEIGIDEAIYETTQKNLFVIAADENLSGAAVELVNEENREFYLEQTLIPIKDQFDIIFIDCSPSLGLLTINAFCASDFVIIPLQCEYFAMEGIAQLTNSIEQIKKEFNENLKIFGILLTMYDTRTRLSQEVAKEIVDAFGDLVFDTIIPRSVRVAEAPSHGVSVVVYDEKSLGAKSYVKVAKEFVKKWQK